MFYGTNLTPYSNVDQDMRAMMTKMFEPHITILRPVKQYKVYV